MLEECICLPVVGLFVYKGKRRNQGRLKMIPIENWCAPVLKFIVWCELMKIKLVGYTQISPPTSCTMYLYWLYTTPTFCGRISWPFSWSYMFDRSVRRIWQTVTVKWHTIYRYYNVIRIQVWLALYKLSICKEVVFSWRDSPIVGLGLLIHKDFCGS